MWCPSHGSIGCVIQHFKTAWQQLTADGAPFATEPFELRGVPMRVFSSAPETMRALWELATLHGDKTYVVYEDEQYTYAEIAARVRALAHALVSRYGVAPGDRVGIAMRNYPEWVISYWATVSIGAAAVGMNAWWTGPEMDYALGDSRPRVLIADGERIERVVPHLAGLRTAGPLEIIAVRTDAEVVEGAATWDEVVDVAAAPDELPPVAIDPDDDATIFYTSGTTGFPKGAQLTHRGSVHNVMHLVFMSILTATADALAIGAGDLEEPVDAPAAPEQAVFMAPTPLFHVTACNCLMHPATLAGGRLVLMYKWDPGRALELIEREGVTNFSGVPTMSRELLMHPDWERRDTTSLRGMGGGGAAVQPDLVAKIDASLANGVPSTGYGLTETHGIVTANSSRYYTSKPSSCGPVVPTLDAKLVGDDGADLEPGPNVVGQLCVRGPIVIKGYLNRPEATAEAIRDGWFNTGDVARIDEDGFVYIVDRAKDMVLRGGENVYCSEVEAAIYRHDDIAEAAVFSIPDERLGENVGAAIVLRPGASLDEAGLREFLAVQIAAYKVPERIWFLDEQLPRNANGKFVKRELRDRLVSELG